MDDAGAMGMGQACAGVLDGFQFGGEWNGCPAPNQARTLASHELHRDERLVFMLAGIEDGDDVRMVQAPGGARFLYQTLSRTGRIDIFVNQLDRDVPIEHRVTGQIHLTHAAASDETDHLGIGRWPKDTSDDRFRTRAAQAPEAVLSCDLQHRLDLAPERIGHL